ncbi:MAG: GIY-YIG nuclease family protein [Bacteroidota bacterium]
MSGFFYFQSMDYCVYVLYSKDFDRIYVGQTSNLIERFKSHNLLSAKGYTLRYRPWIVVHIEFFATRSETLKREKELKQGQGRTWIRTNIIPKYS